MHVLLSRCVAQAVFMYVYMYVCMYILHKLSSRSCMHAWVSPHSMYVDIPMHVRRLTYACMLAHTYVCKIHMRMNFMLKYAFMYVSYVYTYSCWFTYVHILASQYMHLDLDLHTQFRTYMHLGMWISSWFTQTRILTQECFPAYVVI